ncbi:hypothetical protein PSECIP111854_04095 [Pseudoalteromonas sp. CIP111854]|uniref:Tail specific protease domain-containing protein n=1 Tax=Pseudoalteromonas holothuriae TaxID=2963714 RepID=A0A9W4R4Y0_9GAMM|nr:S41 family peptidase [Pseudoalteromonas sp. CIP111854]CAH9067394.1 hypothetical protein PSECIP111854_04095 [Pseudoalteromonas sp. CIP111854]
MTLYKTLIAASTLLALTALIGCQSTNNKTTSTSQKKPNLMMQRDLISQECEEKPVITKKLKSTRLSSWKSQSSLYDRPFNNRHYNKISKRIFKMLESAHFNVTELNNQFSEVVFNQLIYSLDPDFRYLTETDIEELSIYKHSFDDMFKTADLTEAYDFITSVYKKIDSKLNHAESLLEKSSVSDGETKTFTKTSLTKRALNDSELNKFWVKKVTSDRSNLYSLGVDKENISKILKARYKSIRNSTDAYKYDVLMNAYSQSIDPHTSYISPISWHFQEPEVEKNKQFSVGIKIRKEKGKLAIQEIHSSLKSKGIHIKDEVVALVGESNQYIDLIEKSELEANKLLTGNIGTKINIKVLRRTPDDFEIKTIALERLDGLSATTTNSKHNIVSSFNSISKIGTISIPSFYNGLSEDVKQELIKLQSEGMKGLLIDLRNNGGGSFVESTKLASLFVGQGPITQILDGSRNVIVRKEKGSQVVFSGSITILVNYASAGGTEIFTGAMKDYGRALIIGQPTFGYGTLQQYRPLKRPYDSGSDELGNIKYTIAKFYRITGDSTQLKGVTPHIAIPADIHDVHREENNRNALPWDAIGCTTYRKFTFISKVIEEFSTQEIENFKLQTTLGERDVLKAAELLADKFTAKLNSRMFQRKGKS